MKKIFAGMLAGMLVMTAGCGKKEEDTGQKKEEIIAAVTGEMVFAGNWTDTETDDLRMMFQETAENEYDIICYWGKTASEADSWEMHGVYDPASGMLVYENGSYAYLKMNPDGNETRQDETAVSGFIGKQNEEEFTWMDDKLEKPRTMRREAGENIPVIRLAEGPYVMENVSKVFLDDEDRSRFERAVRGQIGVGFTPVQLAARQVVNGMNYAYLAFATYDLGIPRSTYVIVQIHEDPAGEPELTGTEFLDVNDLHMSEETEYERLCGGWEIADNEADGILDHAADDVFAEAVSGYDGEAGNLVPVALLGTDTENDSVSYRLLVRAATEKSWPDKLLYVFEVRNEDGACTVADAGPLDLPRYLNSGEQ